MKTFYHILLKMIRGLIGSKTKSRLKIRLSYVEPKDFKFITEPNAVNSKKYRFVKFRKNQADRFVS